jgi:outer membrane protein TolC
VTIVTEKETVSDARTSFLLSIAPLLRRNPLIHIVLPVWSELSEMRFSIPTTIAIFLGMTASVGNCCQITSLPPLSDTKVELTAPATQPQIQSKPIVNVNVPPQDLGEFDHIFDKALKQFTQDRVAKRPSTIQEPTSIMESQSFQSRPIMRALETVPKITVLENTAEVSNQFKNASTTLPLPAQTQDTAPFGLLATDQASVAVENARQQIQNSIEVSTSELGVSSSTQRSAVPNGFGAFTPLSNSGSNPAIGFTIDSLPATTVATTMAAPALPAMTNDKNPDSLTWWKQVVLQPLDRNRPTESVDSHTLVYRTLQNSPRIQAVSQNPLIRELQIVEADAEFDAQQYIRSQFEDRVDPVGNSLTVGTGESFLKDNIWSADMGLRKKSRNGANWELNQRLGFQNSNSNFFVPQDQGTATLALNVTQPLLRGRGKYYNQSQILIAQATNSAAWQTFHGELQDELLGVVSAYWDLYLNRSVYLQKKRNVERGQKILSRLEGRARLDSLPSQIARARSSVQTRRTELANALRDVRNAETEVRRRIADNSWMNGGGAELIPGELPTAETFQLPLEQVVYAALEHRPEIREAMSRARIATVQRDVSANEIMPELSLLMGSYVSSLRGDTGIGNAFQDQFGQVKPGYSVGVNFELPYGNRAARSRLAQRQLQVKKIKHEVDEVMQSVIAESQVALRRVESASETLFAATEAIRAAQADRNQFENRWESFALVEGDLADGQNPTTVLDQLLDSQDRLASAELVYVQAERELKVSEVALQRAMGTLLMRQNVSTARGYDNDTPRMDILKDGSSLIPDSAGIPTNSMLPQ